MQQKIFIIFFLTVTMLSFAQHKISKADIYYHKYLYAQAISEYQKEKTHGTLSIDKLLNLADSYYKTANYEEAFKVYKDIYDTDVEISNNHFNKMLQCVAKTSADENKVRAFLSSRRNKLTSELIENTNFNYKLFRSTTNETSEVQIFNCNTNSPQADFSPAFYEEKLLFTSSRILNSKEIYAPSGEPYLDIYVSPIELSGNIIRSVKFTEMPDCKFHKATPYYSKKLHKIFYTLSNTRNGKLVYGDSGKNALGIGVWDKNKSSKLLLKDLNVSFYYPFYDEVTDKLFFAANLEGGYGGTDIYYVYTYNGQIMSAPVNLGPRINSPANEIAPYIFENSLYFSSDIFYGLGGMDVYKSTLSEDQQYSIPANLGEGINSAYDDFGFIIKRDTEKENGFLGYFSSNRVGGKGEDDIYSFKSNNELGMKTLTITGKVVNPISNRGISKARVRLLNLKDEVIKKLFTDKDGKYRIELPWIEGITIQSTKARHSTFSASFSQNELDEIQKKSYNMSIVSLDDLLEEKEDKTVIRLKKFYFDKGKAAITSEIETELDKVVATLEKFPKLSLRIESHTDSRGSDSDNLDLSQRRANAIKASLLQKGVPSNALYAVGYGEERITNVCEDGVFCLDMLHQENERTLIVVLNYNPPPLDQNTSSQK